MCKFSHSLNQISFDFNFLQMVRNKSLYKDSDKIELLPEMHCNLFRVYSQIRAVMNRAFRISEDHVCMHIAIAPVDIIQKRSR